MNGDRVVIDTNIALYLLNGDRELADMLFGKQLIMSNITRMELLGFPDLTKAELARIEVFMESWPIVEMHSLIEDLAIGIRRKHRLKLPDSIIAATALHLEVPLLTADRLMDRLIPDVEVIRYERLGS